MGPHTNIDMQIPFVRLQNEIFNRIPFLFVFLFVIVKVGRNIMLPKLLKVVQGPKVFTNRKHAKDARETITKRSRKFKWSNLKRHTITL